MGRYGSRRLRILRRVRSLPAGMLREEAADGPSVLGVLTRCGAPLASLRRAPLAVMPPPVRPPGRQEELSEGAESAPVARGGPPWSAPAPHRGAPALRPPGTPPPPASRPVHYHITPDAAHRHHTAASWAWYPPRGAPADRSVMNGISYPRFSSARSSRHIQSMH